MMNIKAKLLQLLPLQTGIGKNGQWRKQDIIVETDAQYPKKLCLTLWGDKIDEKLLNIGNLLEIDFDMESREYNNKWYTDVRVLKINLVENITVPKPIESDFLPEENFEDDGLPF